MTPEERLRAAADDLDANVDPAEVSRSYERLAEAYDHVERSTEDMRQLDSLLESLDVDDRPKLSYAPADDAGPAPPDAGRFGRPSDIRDSDGPLAVAAYGSTTPELRPAITRPYTGVRSRTRSRVEIALEALVETTVRGRAAMVRRLQGEREQRHIAAMCDGSPQSLAEIAARRQLPSGVARVIVADMAADGLLAVYEPVTLADETDTAGTELLERVLNRLRGLGTPQRSVPGRVTSAKIVIAGGSGAGKATLIGSASETAPMPIKAVLTSAGVAASDAAEVPGKPTSVVAMDFGRIDIDHDSILYLFGTPKQTRYWFMWDELVQGAIGAVVMVDTRRIVDCFAAIDFLENRRLPYLVAINRFDGMEHHSIEEVRAALAVEEKTPVLSCDARNRESATNVLVSLVEHVLTPRQSRAALAERPEE